MVVSRRTAFGFWRNERGNFGVFAALAMLPLLLFMGGAIDFSMFYSAKVKIQNAADGAALAAAKQFAYAQNEDEIKAFAENYFRANTGDIYRTAMTFHYDGTTWDENNVRSLKLHIDYDYDPIFLGLVELALSGATEPTLESTVASTVAIGETTLEVAFVLDTSGSMNERPDAGGEVKIATLRKVASDAMDTLFSSAGGSATEDPVQVAVVPFSGAVNVGTDNAGAAWMDRYGYSSLHQENFDWSTWTDANGNAKAVKKPDGTWRLKSDESVYLTRQYVFANSKISTNARKCYFKNTRYPTNGECKWVDTTNGWVFYRSTNTSSGNLVCRQSNDAQCKPSYQLTYQANPAYAWKGCVEMRPGDLKITDTAPSAGNGDSYFVPYFAPDESDANTQGFRNSYLKDIEGTDQTKQQKAMNKYLLSTELDDLPANGSEDAAQNRYSPNYACAVKPMMPLTANKASAKTMVEALQAVDATNVTEGVAWGWRTLSPRAPFTGGRAIGDETNVKAMIVMTDGANTYYAQDNANKSRFGAFGYSAAGHIFDVAGKPANHTASGFTAAMDSLNTQVCANARNDGRVPVRNRQGTQYTDTKGPVTRDGVMIYTIAFDIPPVDATRVDALLKACASTTIEDLKNTALPYADKKKHFYRAKNAAELDEAFAEILASLSNLRIAH